MKKIILLLISYFSFQCLQAQDVGVTALVNPITPMCPAINQTVVITVMNYDVAPIDFAVNNMDLIVNVTGASTQNFLTTIISGTLAAGATQDFTVTTIANLSVAGTHVFDANTAVVADVNNANDAMPTTNIVVQAAPTINIAVTNFGFICPGGTATLTASGATTYTWSANAGSATTPSVAVSPSVTTVYTVTGTNAAGCSSSKTRTVTVNPTATITISGNSFLCQGQSSVLTASGGTSYTWTAGPNTASISITPTVTTSYTVTGAGGFGVCPGTAVKTVTVTTTPPPTVTISGSTVTCSGQPDLLTANGALNYTWSANAGSATTATVAPSPTVNTNYTVTGIDINGCAGTGTFSVSVIANPIVNIASAPSSTICAGNTATLTASGATTYTWSANAGSATTATVTITPSVTTVYSVTGTNAAGCMAVKTRTITVNPAPSLTVTPATICTGATATLTASGANTYTWSPGLSSTNGATVTGSPTVTTTYTVAGTNINGCIGLQTVAINVVTNLTVTATSSSSVTCAGTALTLTGLGASSYTWNAGGGTISGGSGTTVTVTPVGPATSYTVSGSSGTCTATPYVFAITVNPNPTVTATASPNDTICNGSSVTLSGGGAISYVWTGGVTNAVAFSPTVTATYSVTGTDANGCKGNAVQTVTVRALPGVNFTTGGAAGGVCPGTLVTLTGSGATTYTWVNTGSNANILTATPTVTTSYTLTGSDAFGCVGTRIRTIPMFPTPTATVSAPASICAGQTATLTSTATNTVTVTSYSWSTGATTASTTDSPTVTTTYTLLVAGTQCTDTIRTTISVGTPPSITVTATSNPICQASTETLTASGATSYTWHPTNSNASSISGVANSSVTFTVIGSNGACIDSVIYAVVVNPLPVISVAPSSNPICQGATETLTASGAASYTWHPTNSTTSSISGVANASVTYTVIGSSAAGCVDSVNYSLVVNPLPVINITPSSNPICQTSTETLTASGATSYTWHPTNSTTSSISGVANSSVTFTVIGSTGAGCVDSVNYSLVVNPLPTIGITSNPVNDSVCVGNTATLTGTGASSYTWTGGITDGVAFTPTVTATYTVTGTDGNNCTNTNSVTVIVSTCATGMISNSNTQIKVYPNPSNGNLFVSINNFENTSIEVFNSLGEKVYSKTISTNTESINLEKLNAGLYFVHVKQNGSNIYRSNIVLTK